MKLAEVSSNLKTTLELGEPPIAVKLFKFSDNLPTEIKVVDRKSRYCQFLMLARQGETLLLTPEKLACPAANAAFGFGPLPEKVSSGQMLHVLGLYQTKEAAANTMATMPRLKANSISAIAAGPLEVFPLEPDIVIVEGATGTDYVALSSKDFRNRRTIELQLFNLSVLLCRRNRCPINNKGSEHKSWLLWNS